MFALVSAAGTDRERVPDTQGSPKPCISPRAGHTRVRDKVWAEVAPRVWELWLVLQEPPGLGHGQGLARRCLFLLQYLLSRPLSLSFMLGPALLPWGTAWLHPRGSHPTPNSHGTSQTHQDQSWGKKGRERRNWGGLSTSQGCCSLPVLLTPLPAPILQVMLLGDSGVGKTCFLLQFKDGAFFSGTFIATVGIDYRVRPPRLPAPRLPQPAPWPGRGAGEWERGVSSLCTLNYLPISSRCLLEHFHPSLGEQ